MAKSEALLQETIDGVVLLTINRPERRNALSHDLWLELRELLGELRSDTGGLIVTGAGDRAFAAGADVAELVDRSPLVALDGLVQGILLQLQDLPFPTIAALNGHALGGGWELALACDLRLAVSSARVGFPEVGLGIIPGAGGTIRLLEHVGVGRAMEWILTGRLLDAHEAASYGLINRVVGDGDVVAEALSLMKELQAQPRLAVRLAKMMVKATARGEASPDLERLAYTLTYHSPERSERMHHFLDQRSKRDGKKPADTKRD
ncbi:MAG: enoyl-CoA hydratase/isomerase family protein [Actinomycetota bacterium]|nr:enoyl-CoA hydratase/isomerase family protein [Actinomycetota bacterium]